MQTRLLRSPLPARGFSLVEMMVALAVLGLAVAGTVIFTYQALNTYYYESGRLLLNHDMRKFTNDMTTDAVYSNYFEIYPDFATRSKTTAGVTTDAWLPNNQSGDFLLLVFASTNPSSGVTTVNRLIGYYRDTPDPTDPTKSIPTNSGSVRRFDVAISPAVVIGSPTNAGATPPVYTMYDLLNKYAPTGTTSTTIAVQTATGFLTDPATGTICRIFYNYRNSSVMVNGQFTENGNLIRKAANTYNFTVSPRG
ncbi:MAG TPA: prepilin-type N-terminal cleavage/methylation domain-containing protein [Opitutaceae bacterium]|jgi:prepilin-type N-terminal cleavage/methylation domain-containing protein|nr:prepilin-type N-terminal cleavage/methylation domain-containing protein [Opitutaceae bacterium]